MSNGDIIFMLIFAVCLVGFAVSSLNEAIETHRRGRYAAAMNIIDRGINELSASEFARHDNWLEGHARAWWIKLTDRERHGDNIAERSDIEDVAGEMVTKFQMHEFLTKKYNNA